MTDIAPIEITCTLITAGSRIRAIIKVFQNEIKSSAVGSIGGDRITFFRQGLTWEIEVSATSIDVRYC